jgi:hypothetical protein
MELSHTCPTVSDVDRPLAVSGGNPRKKSGKTPPAPGSGCGNLRPLGGFKTMYRSAHARTHDPGGAAAC